MSPLTMGLLALLAYKAFKSGGPLGNIFGPNANQSGTNPNAPHTPANSPNASGPGGGGLSDWLRTGLGGALAGGAAGGIVTSGLAELLKRMQQNGQGNVAQSWVGTGPNDQISTGDLEKAAGADTLDALAKETGMHRQQLIENLRAELPDAVNTLTPQGRIPTNDEVLRWG
jgi:uncharacterized protein YidB (DUF937 family)